MSITRVVGYTADADYWCVSCAETTYNFSEGDINYNPEDVVDHEGNEVYPIFTLESDSPTHCNQCHELIEDQYLTPDGEEYAYESILEDLRNRNWNGTAWTVWLDEFGKDCDKLKPLYELKYAGNICWTKPGIQEAIEGRSK